MLKKKFFNMIGYLLGTAAIAGLNSILGRRADLQNARMNYQTNMELAKYQNDRNLELWNMQNAYNHPAMQMQRLQEANLNPNLIYGSSSPTNRAETPAPTQVPTYEQNVRPFEFMNIFNQYLDLKAKEASIAQTYENIAATRQKRDNDAIIQGILSTDKKTKDLDYGYKSETYFYNVESKRLAAEGAAKRLEKLMNEIDLTKEQKELIKAQVSKVLQEARSMYNRNQFWEEEGGTMTDPWFVRRMSKFWDEIDKNPDIPGPVKILMKSLLGGTYFGR